MSTEDVTHTSPTPTKRHPDARRRLRTRVALLGAGALLASAAGSGCKQALGLTEGDPIEQTAFDGTACPNGPLDCPLPAPGCGDVACIEGVCRLTPVTDGQPVTLQTPGDCAIEVCDGKGGTRLVADTTDAEDDHNDCTTDACESGLSTHTPVTQASCYSGLPGTEGIGNCHGGIQSCANGQPVGGCVGEVPCECVPDQVEDCYDGPAGTENVGECVGSTHTCSANGAWSACAGQVLPATEVCELGQHDEDCDGLVNENPGCACGDGSVSTEMLEQCDDGNVVAGDGCSASCQREILELALGGYHTCARFASRRIKCWGYNYYGQLGLGDSYQRGDAPNEMGGSLPYVDLGANADVTALALGGNHSCAVLLDGRVKCWGDDYYSQLGIGDAYDNRGTYPGEMGDNLPAVVLGSGRTATAVATGASHTCALLDAGDVRCWGENGFGQLGTGDTSWGYGYFDTGDSIPLVALGTGRTAVAIAAGISHTCALLDDASVKCWGVNGSGQLGQGDTTNRGGTPQSLGDGLLPIDLGAGRTAVAIAAGGVHTCAVLDDGHVKCWGANGSGQLGLGDNTPRGGAAGQMGDALPNVDLGAGRTAVALAAGGNHTCALLDDASVKCWGANTSGTLGLGNTAQQSSPTAAVDLGVGLGGAALAPGGNADHTCIVRSDGVVRCWGYNGMGALGHGDTTNWGVAAGQMGATMPGTPLLNLIY